MAFIIPSTCNFTSSLSFSSHSSSWLGDASHVTTTHKHHTQNSPYAILKDNSNNNNNNNNNSNNNNKRFRPRRQRPNNNNNNNNINNNFKPFNGSMPLLPAWRPSSLEEQFHQISFHRSHLIKPVSETQPLPLFTIGNGNSIILYASLIQTIDENRVWLRPLILTHTNNDSFIDLRPASVSDVVLDCKFIKPCDSITTMKMRMNLTATESEVIEQGISNLLEQDNNNNNNNNNNNSEKNNNYQNVANHALVQFLNDLHSANQ